MCCVIFFFFNDTATTEIYTLSLHDALPISATRAGDSTAASSWSRFPRCGSRESPSRSRFTGSLDPRVAGRGRAGASGIDRDRKSTRLNSSHLVISYAVFCLKKKKKQRLHLH